MVRTTRSIDVDTLTLSAEDLATARRGTVVSIDVDCVTTSAEDRREEKMAKAIREMVRAMMILDVDGLVAAAEAFRKAGPNPDAPALYIPLSFWWPGCDPRDATALISPYMKPQRRRRRGNWPRG